MNDKWYDYFLTLINGKKSGILARTCLGTLRVISWGFVGVSGLRNWAFERGFFRSYRPPVPVVISIGNIVAGGTGKTPVTLKLAQELIDEAAVAIISRGYRSKIERRSNPTFLSEGKGPIYSAAYCGDEPYLLARHIPEALVIVGKNRKEAAALAVKAGAQVILLDDAMQHRHIARDLEIVVINSKDPFGQGYFLPRGLLRESIYALERANLIILNHVKDNQHFSSLQRRLKQYTGAPMVGTSLEVETLWNHKKEKVRTVAGKKVGIFCGIGSPKQFEETVLSLGADPIATRFLPDHKGFDQKKLNTFAKKCAAQGASYLLCTEKDFVKLPKMKDLPLPILWPQMSLKIVEGQQHWEAFLDLTKNEISKKSCKLQGQQGS